MYRLIKGQISSVSNLAQTLYSVLESGLPKFAVSNSITGLFNKQKFSATISFPDGWENTPFAALDKVNSTMKNLMVRFLE